MIPSINPSGSNTRGLLAYLYGPGRHDEHLDPHIVAAFATLGLPDPGRDTNESTTLTKLARYLDQPVDLRNREVGKKIPQHVWHCSVRTAPEDRTLSDAEWGEVARRIVHATGIAPDGDDQGCRWIAVRHAEDHIHIVATTVREDGRRPKRHNERRHAQSECRTIETELGLRRLNTGDGTAAQTPTQGEMHKAERLGWDQTSRQWLEDRIREAIPHAHNAEELLAYLQADGVQVKPRYGPSGDLLGYSAGRPGDLNKDGQQVFHPGGKIAPDLSLPRLQARLATTTPAEHPTARRNRPSSPWQRATQALDTLTADFTDPATSSGTTGDGSRAQAQIAALGELIEATAQAAPEELRTELRAATKVFARAQRSQTRAEHTAPASLRTAARDLIHAGNGKDGSAAATLLAALLWAAVLAGRWHEARGHAQQTAAAHQAVQHLQIAYDQAAAKPLADLAHRQPNQETRNTLAADVRNGIPEHAARILADPDWPALATVLADAEAAGHQPRHLLNEAAARRELDTARQPARVLLSRIQHTARNPAPNPRAEAARLRSSAIAVPPTRPQPTQRPTTPVTQPDPRFQHRLR